MADGASNRRDADPMAPREELARWLRPPASIRDKALQAPLSVYGRNYRAFSQTANAWSSGWQVPLALAAWTGDESADEKLLKQVTLNLSGAQTINATGGYPSEHERPITGMYAILRDCPRFWQGRLSADQRARIDLIMKAALVASAYTTADSNYEDGNRPTALDGNSSLGRGWNPNFREGMIGALIVGAAYFGGIDVVRQILDAYRHDDFVRLLHAARLHHLHETFTWRENHSDSAAPDGERIERAVRGYRLFGEPAPEPFAVYRDLTRHTFSGTVSPGLRGGKGILWQGVPTGVMVDGADDLPHRGLPGMARELDARDPRGLRSSMIYAFNGVRPNLIHHVVLLLYGYWPRNDESRELVQRLRVGIGDMIYKLERGYRNYANGAGEVEPVITLDTPYLAWSLRTLLPLWTEVLEPFHRQWE